MSILLADTQVDILPLHIIKFGSNNEINVDVNNSFSEERAPTDDDFTFYGGIYRNVHLLFKNSVCFVGEEQSYKPLKIETTDVSDESGCLLISAMFAILKEKP